MRSKSASRRSDCEVGNVTGSSRRGGKVCLGSGDDVGVRRTLVFGEELCVGDATEIVQGVVERRLECRTPEENERGQDQAQSADEQAQARLGLLNRQ